MCLPLLLALEGGGGMMGKGGGGGETDNRLKLRAALQPVRSLIVSAECDWLEM